MARSSGFRLASDGCHLANDVIDSDDPNRTLSASVTAFSRRPVLIMAAAGEKSRPFNADRTHRQRDPSAGRKEYDRMPNEDSVSFEFDDTSLFSRNRFGGIDRVEGGRINYGLNSGFFGLSGGFSSFFIGQSYRLDESDDFDQTCQTNIFRTSSAVSVFVLPVTWTRCIASVDKATWPPAKRIYSVDGCTASAARRSYLSIDQQTSSTLDPRTISETGRNYARHSLEISLTAGVGASTRRDLTSGGGALQHGASYPTRTTVSSFGPIIPARLPATESASQIHHCGSPLRLSENCRLQAVSTMPFTKLKRDESRYIYAEASDCKTDANRQTIPF